MRALRATVSWLFAISAFSCLGIAVRFSHEALGPSDGLHADAILLQLLIGVVFAVLGLVFAMACWAGIREKPSARRWGIAASVIIILAALFPLALYLCFDNDLAGLLPGLSMMAVVMGVGVAGLIAFARPAARGAELGHLSQAAPVPGDGTIGVVNKAAGFLAVGLSYIAFSWWLRWLWGRELWQGRNLCFDNVALFAVLAILILVHELGHAVAGLLLGMKLRMFALGPLEWSRSKGKWKFELTLKKMALRDGAVGLLPAAPRTPRWHGALVAAAGPAANLISGAAALCVAITSNSASPLESHGFLALFGAMSLAMGISSLVPFRMGQYYSDGARCRQHLSNSPFSDFRRVLLSVAAVAETSMRPRDYDMEAIERAQRAFPAGMEGHYLKLYAFDCYFDQGKTAEAAKALTEAEAIYDAGALKAETEVSFVMGYAGLAGDPVAARRWWQRLEARSTDRSDAGYWLAKCAMASAEGREEDASEALRQADAVIAAMQPTGSQAYDAAWSARLREETVKDHQQASAAFA
jgi:tetratricopeptide (TPR) repeat protein